MKEQSTSKGFAILSAATLVMKILSLVYNPLLVWVLGGNRVFGIYNITYQIYVFIYVITNTGLPSAISKIVSEYAAVGNYRSAKKVFKISRMLLVLMGLLMALIMFIFAGPITAGMKFPEAKESVMALCPALIFTALGSSYRGYFQGMGNMKPTAISQLLEQIINTIFSLIFAAIFIRQGVVYGVVGATIGTTLGALASSMLLMTIYEKSKHTLHTKKTANVDKHSNKFILKRIVKYSIPITVSIGAINAATLIDSTNTVHRLVAGGITVPIAQTLTGTYALFNQLIGVPIAIITALCVNILPAVSRAVALGDKKLVGGKINFATRLCLLIAIPSAVGLTVLSKPIYTLLHYKTGHELLIYGTIIVVLMSLSQMQTSILQGLGKIYVATLYSIIGIVIKLIVNYVLIVNPNINIYGAIVGSFAGFLVPVILNTMYIQNRLRIKIKLKSQAFKPIIASVFMGMVLWVVYSICSLVFGVVIHGTINNDISTVIAMFAGMLAYFYAIFLIRGITKEELEIIPYKLRRKIPRKLLANIQ